MKNKVFKNSFIYVGGTIVGKMIPFLLLPIITSKLAPESYGNYSIFLVFITFTIPFITMSMDTNIVKNFYKFEKFEMTQLLKSILALLVLHIGLFISLLLVMSLFFYELFSVEFKYLFFLPLIIFAQTINSYYLSILRLEENATGSVIFEISQAIMTAALTLMLLFVFKLDWMSLIYSMMIISVFYCVFAVNKLNAKYSIFQKGIKYYNIRDIYKVSIPLIFHLLGGSIIFMSDRLFIEHFIDLKAVGIYAVALQLGMITKVLIESILRAYQPYFFKQLSLNNDKLPMYNQLLGLGFVLLSLCVWIVTYFLFEVIIDDRYIDGRSVIIWISLGYAIRGLYMLYYNIMISESKTTNIAKLTFFAAILNLVLNYFLIQLNGLEGIAQATVLTFLLMAIFTMYLSNKYHKYNWILTLGKRNYV